MGPEHPFPFAHKRCRGASLVLFMLLAALVLLPLLGLAIDGAVVFWVRAKLSAAVDAAALAGGRSINVYYTQAQNSGTAVTAAQEWFSANYPSGWLGTSIVGGTPTVTVQPTQTATQQVNVSASVAVPLYFMRLLGRNSITISAAAQSSRRNLNLVLVLDRSSSLGPAPIGVNSCPQMKAAAQNFVNMFTENFDTLSLVTFSTTANANPIDFAPSATFKTALNSKIASINCVGTTSTAQGLYVAYQSIKSQGLVSALNVIVLFTDGQPNEVVAPNWQIKSQVDNRNSPLSPWSLANNVAASACNGGNPLSGALTIDLDSTTSYQDYPTGYTMGLFNPNVNVPINSASFPPLVSASNCQYTSDPRYVRNDIAYIPTRDAYGNSTTGPYKTVDQFQSGLNGPNYAGQMRDDEQIAGIIAAAFNAADNQATAIRNDSTYNIVIYTIGLDGALDAPVDSTFLERVANDPRSAPFYDSSKPAGHYAYAANPGALSQAFNEVASQILRLSQ